MKTLNIGLFGFGCVGQGLYDVLHGSLHHVGKIKRICVKNKDKSRTLPPERFTFDKWDILNDTEIDTVVELIDDAEEAYRIVKTAMENGKNVVTANKKMLANHLPELQELSEKKGVGFLYEASACGSIPVIRLLEEYYDNEDLQYIGGIFNGTTNYILTHTCLFQKNYEDALKEAQNRGFAESNPESDVEGWDALYKLVILSFHSFGLVLDFIDVPRLGITTLSDKDNEFARRRNYRIRLLACAGISKDDNVFYSFVLPVFVDESSSLFDTNFEFNGVITEGKFTSRQFLKGKGAGGHPTGSAVLSDLSALRYGYRYEFKKKNFSKKLFPSHKKFRVYVRTERDDSYLNDFIHQWEEITYDSEYFQGIGWVEYEKLRLLVPVLRSNFGFIAMVGEPWNQEKKNAVFHLSEKSAVF